MNITWWGKSDSHTLEKLFWFRSVLIVVQVATSLLAKYVFSVSFGVLGVSTIIAILILVNAYTWTHSKRANEASPSEIFTQLLIDLMALSALFYFAGGAANPFVSMYLLPLAVGSILLSQGWILGLALTSILAYSYLMWFHPEQHSQHNHQAFNMHLIGMWVSFVLSAGVIALFIANMRSALQRKDKLLTEAREQSIKDEKLVSLGTLAASTAHEMGNPLATIQLICSDLKSDTTIPQQEIDTLVEQVRRCKQALQDMSSIAGSIDSNDANKLIPFESFLIELIEDWQLTRPQCQVIFEFQKCHDGFIHTPAVLAKALVNLLDNAADASPLKVSIYAACNQHEADILIQNEGERIAEETILDIGSKPYSSKPDGIGLGAFLAHEVIQKMGGSVALSNRSSGGVETLIKLPLRKTNNE
jgi:two-component system sensor histidine kinase RegB